MDASNNLNQNTNHSNANSERNLHEYCLKWSNYHTHVLRLLAKHYQSETMADVTLCATGGQRMHAHRVVLCASSSYFEKIFSQTPEPHPIVSLADVSGQELKSVLEFIYTGELSVEASHLHSVLQVAENLQIRGLMDVSSEIPTINFSHCEEATIVDVPQIQIINDAVGLADIGVAIEIDGAVTIQPQAADINTLDVTKDQASAQIIYELQENIATVSEYEEIDRNDEDSQQAASQDEEQNDSDKAYNPDGNQKRKKRKRRENSRKDYSEEQLSGALADLKAGHLLAETATTHRIPRSTLYVRAKAAGIPLTVSRQEHNGERVQAAVQAVTSGASLQQASSLYQIPKTVLWRRVRAATASSGWKPWGATSRRHGYGMANRQAAVQALQSGQNLTKVSAQFQIPKTTLFRDKARLVEAGKLPWNCLKRRDPNSYAAKQSRIKQAVAACREGKMSQAVAAVTYQVPKTTIWRRLRKVLHVNSQENTKDEEVVIDLPPEKQDSDVNVSRLQEQVVSFPFYGNNVQIPVTYIVEEADFSEAQLMI